MFPYHDENETLRTPIVTYVLLGVNVAAWFLVQGAGAPGPLGESVCNLGLIPGEFTLRADVGDGFELGDGRVCLVDPGRAPMHVLTSMFLHGGWGHILGNMWFLWLFGNNVEDSMGRGRFIAFYLLSGVGAALAQVATNPASIVPMVGASGAISGVMGAYVILYPNVRVFTFVPLGFIFTTIALPAWVMLGYWMALQIFGGLGATGEGGVAFWAHIGGFAVGAATIKLFARREYVQQHRTHHWKPSSGRRRRF